MDILAWLYDTLFFSSNGLLVCFMITITVLTASTLIAYHFQHSGYVLATVLLSIGAHLLVLACIKITLVRAIIYLGVTFCFCALAYSVALLSIGIKASLIKRKQEREKIERAVCYTLPTRENEYVRNRLHFVMQDNIQDEEERLTVCFSYVIRALSRLKNVKLTLTERLEIERIEKMIMQYKNKQSFTTQDVHLLNETFSKLMKLSSKYAVKEA